MKPVAVFRHAATEGPAYFATFLERHGIPWRLVAIDAGEPVPAEASAFSGLAFMGGPMSVNDDLPWIPRALALIRAAVAQAVPVIGHCLGGQLMAKALGAEVTRNRVKEIGWGRIALTEGAPARHWFGDLEGPVEVFHWHGETFSLPPGADHLAYSAHCAHQAFALGPHLAMQCHVEMTPELIEAWCRDWGREVQSLAARMPSVQTPAEMTESALDRTRALHAVADRLYGRWIEGLGRA
jgi:GMP synthase-like glutamine amidotransferase